MGERGEREGRQGEMKRERERERERRETKVVTNNFRIKIHNTIIMGTGYTQLHNGFHSTYHRHEFIPSSMALLHSLPYIRIQQHLDPVTSRQHGTLRGFIWRS